MPHRTAEELTAALPHVRSAPADGGTLHLIVCRPGVDEREILEEGDLDLTHGLVGDTWEQRVSSRMPEPAPHPDMQLNVMSWRAVSVLAGDDDQARAQAGDQLYVDLDLSYANLPPGTRLAIGSAVIEVTAEPHTGCSKFTQRFGLPAHRWVNSPEGRELNLRGINARVVVPGRVRRGDAIAVTRPA